MQLIDDEERFLTQLEARLRQLAERVRKGELAEAYASFEILCSLYSAKGIEDDKLTRAFPSEAWRNDCVPVPRLFLASLARGWVSHKEGEADLAKALGLAAPSKGARPTVSEEVKRERDIRLANKVVLELAAARMEGKPISIDAACETVRESTLESRRVIERAYKAHGAKSQKALAEIAAEREESFERPS